MGTKLSRNKNKKKSIVKMNSKLLESIICPYCEQIFGKNIKYSQLNIHLQECGKSYARTHQETEVYSPFEDHNLNDLILKGSIISYMENQDIITNYNDFDEKINKLKDEINSVKISWELGCCDIKIHRSNILEESIEQIQKIDIYKEWKIHFIGEVGLDSGGLTREWYASLFKALQDPKLQLFIPSETENYSFLINPFLKRKQNNYKYFDFIGKIMAKALIDNITVNICFNKLIYKLLLKEKVELEDLRYVNQPLYTSIKNSLNLIDYTDCGIFYNIQIKDMKKKIHSLDLIPNGKNIPVKNINDYLTKRIEFISKLYEPFIKRIRENFFNVFPEKAVQSFTSEQLELLLNGRPFIDVQEWEESTIYHEPYHRDHYIIRWFWEILTDLSQNELGKFLMFCTGSSRVPLGGFSYLESNRGNKSNFTIESVPYDKNGKNFIKAHTCFNRIDIPIYINKEELKDAILFSCKCCLGFGID